MNQKNGGKAQQAIHPGMEIAELRAEITRIPSSGKKRGIGFVAFVATLGSFLLHGSDLRCPPLHVYAVRGARLATYGC